MYSFLDEPCYPEDELEIFSEGHTEIYDDVCPCMKGLTCVQTGDVPEFKFVSTFCLIIIK